MFPTQTTFANQRKLFSHVELDHFSRDNSSRVDAAFIGSERQLHVRQKLPHSISSEVKEEFKKSQEDVHH